MNQSDLQLNIECFYLCAKDKDSYYAYICLMYPKNENAMPIVLFQYANFQAE